MLRIQSARDNRFLSLNTHLQTQEIDPRIEFVRELNGIFIGKQELLSLEKLSKDIIVPAIPEKFSQAFLESKHPFRDGQIASHIILAFSPEGMIWHCIDRGHGGKSDVVPGSVGLSGDKQDRLLKVNNAAIKIAGVEISSAQDSLAVKKILDSATNIHLQSGKLINDAPFFGLWGRTADVQLGNVDCRVLLGQCSRFGAQVHSYFMSDLANDMVGLLAEWK